MHNAFSNTLKTVPTQSHIKFDFRDDQSTHPTILEEKLAATFCYKWSEFRPRNRSYFIKAAYKRNNFRIKFVSGKM